MRIEKLQNVIKLYYQITKRVNLRSTIQYRNIPQYKIKNPNPSKMKTNTVLKNSIMKALPLGQDSFDHFMALMFGLLHRVSSLVVWLWDTFPVVPFCFCCEMNREWKLLKERYFAKAGIQISLLGKQIDITRMCQHQMNIYTIVAKVA